MRVQILTIPLTFAVAIVTTIASAQNLLRNPSFETVPSSETGQGILPSEWAQFGNLSPGADTWSEDGSYGLPPGNFGQFSGATAADGIRWVAGAGYDENAYEALTQLLSQPLCTDQQYVFRASLRLTTRPGEDAPGGYRIFLSAFADSLDEAILVGSLAEVSSSTNWQERSVTFTAPSNSQALTYFVLVPYVAEAGQVAYVGIDNLCLTNTTDCCPLATIRVSEIEVCWPSQSNRLYGIDYRSDLTTNMWLPLFTNILGSGQMMCVGDHVSHPQRFYRIVCPTNQMPQ